MKAETLQILWHDKEPIYTCDTSGDLMVTAGVDSVIRVAQNKRTMITNFDSTALPCLSGILVLVDVASHSDTG